MFSKPPNTDAAKPPVSGLLFMFKSLGLESVIDAAQKMASAGTVQKILEFADALPEIKASLARIEGVLGIDPNTAPGGLVALAIGAGPSERDGNAGRTGDDGAPNRPVDDDAARNSYAT